MAIKKLNRPQSLFELALTNIRTAIIDGTIQLGEHLSEVSISESLGVSKTPVREALQELRREGLVRIGANSGTTVFFPDADELHDIFDYRALLELGAAERMFDRDWKAAADKMAAVVAEMHKAVAEADYTAYRRLDSALHHVVIEASGNALIVNAYAPLTAKVDALRNRGLEDISVVRRSLEYHEMLSDLLAANKRKAFCAALQTHIANSNRDYATWLAGETAKIGAGKPASPLRTDTKDLT